MNVLASGSLGPTAASAAQHFLNDESTGHETEDHSNAKVTPHTSGWAAPSWYIVLRDRATAIAKRSPDGPSVSSEHIVLAMTEVDGFVKEVLEQHGIQHHDVNYSLNRIEAPVEKLNVDLTLFIDDESKSEEAVSKPSDAVSIDLTSNTSCQSNHDHRIHALLDANLNRAREGLRVLEDCARFIVCCLTTTERLKNVRHQLVEAEVRLRRRHPLIQRRDVEADAGTEITTANEQHRSNLQDIMTANCRRMQEAIRSLEEFGKLVDARFSEECKQLRYQTYQAEQMLESRMALWENNLEVSRAPLGRTRQQRQELLSNSHLYVLMTEEFCRQPWKQTAEAIVRAGTDIIQLREKQLPTAELLKRAVWLRDLCLEHNSLFFMNDDVELAQSVNADGVHVGQTDLPVNDVRQVLHSDQLIGLSTHNLDQLNRAAELKVDYVGVGPMFPTGTKSFDAYSGPPFASEASANSTLPWFAIGGIDQGNLPELLGAGVRRIAVCGAVLATTSPHEATRQLKQQLVEAGQNC